MTVTYCITGVMAASEIPPQMANFKTFYRAAFYFFLAAKTAHFAHCYFVLNFGLSAQRQHIFVFINTPKLQFSAQWNDRNLINRIGPS